MTMIGGEGLEGIGKGTAPQQHNPFLKGAEIGKLDELWNDFPLSKEGPFILVRNVWRALAFGGLRFAGQVGRLMLVTKWMVEMPDLMRRNLVLAQAEDVWPNAAMQGVALNQIYDSLGVGPHVVVVMPRLGGTSGMIALANWRDSEDMSKAVEESMASVSGAEHGETGHGPSFKDAGEFLDSLPMVLREFFAEPDRVRTDAKLREKLDRVFMERGAPDGFAGFVKHRDEQVAKEGKDPDESCGCPFCALRRAYLDGIKGDDIGPIKGSC